MRVELPVANPKASAYQFYAFPLAILEAHDIGVDWRADNFIQLAYDKRREESPVPFCFYTNDHTVSPWLNTMSMTSSWFENGDVAASLRKAVSQGWYVYAFFNEYHLPCRRGHGKWEYVHDSLIHGYDDETDEFLVYGYDRRMLLASAWTGAEHVRTAYMSALEQDLSYTRVVLYRPDLDGEHPLDVPLISRTIREYLNGDNTSEHFAANRAAWDRCYGVDTYGPLKDCLLTGRDFDNIRNMQVLWEHKALMTERAVLLAEKHPEVKSVIPELQLIEDRAHRLRKAVIRMKYSDADFDRSELPAELDRIKDMEAVALSRLLAAL